MGAMNRLVALLILLVAATLETGGDALVRAGIKVLLGTGRILAGKRGDVVPLRLDRQCPALGLRSSWGVRGFRFSLSPVLAITRFGPWPDLGEWLGVTLSVCGGIVIAMSAR
jgi:hypothetical protein